MPRLAPAVTRQSDFYLKQKKTVHKITGFLLSALVFCQMATMKAICSENVHPGVVCVIAWEPGSSSRGSGGLSGGSGSLIGKKESYGYIITNWHVVRDSTGLVMIRYADGTTAKGVVISVDSLWDLALIATTAPQTEPIRIASSPPQKGDPLWLAGYGSDNTYKMAGGYCTQYVSPSVARKEEKELLEFTAVARRGDSGGPIFNKKSELAGVLFGTNSKVTLGSYCGRVLKFIDQSAPYVLALPGDPEELFTRALAERRTILQRNTVTKPPVVNSTLSTTGQASTQSVANYSSSSSFGGGGSKRKPTNIQPVADPFLSVESIQPHLGFQGFDYKKETVSTAVQSRTTFAASSGKTMSETIGSSQALPPSTQNYQSLPSIGMPIASSGTSSDGGYSSSRPVGNPASSMAQTSWNPTTPAREISGGSTAGERPSSSAPSPYSPSATYSPNGSTYQGNRYGSSGTTSNASSGLGPGHLPPVAAQSVTSLPPVTSSPYAAPSGSNSGSHSSPYPGYSAPANRSYTSDKASGYDHKTNYDNRNDRAPDYFGGSYSGASTLTPRESHSPYSRFQEPETELMEGEIREKYASPSAIAKSSPGTLSKTMITPRSAVKIIGAVIVIFFVLFHAVKLMSIIEEQ